MHRVWSPGESEPNMMDTETPELELLTVGRISVDLYAEQLQVPMREVASFRKSVGGTATNVAVAAARLGHRAAVFTRVGDDPFGHYIRWALANTFGVDVRYVSTDPSYRTPLAFATMEDPAEPSLTFYREPKAPDMEIRSDDVDRDTVTSVPILWVPASRLSAEPSRTTIHDLLAWRGRRTHTILDLDWRAQFWPDKATATAALDPVLDSVTMAIGNREECAVALGLTDSSSDASKNIDPYQAADALLQRGLQAVVVKLGGDGVLVADAGGRRERIAPYPVEVVCGLGAGDAFGGAFCHGLLSGWDLARCARAGNAAGAIVASRLMCADDMPHAEEIDAALDR